MTNPSLRHKHLNRQPSAMQQGPHRYARGMAFFQKGKEEAARLGVRLAWSLYTVPGELVLKRPRKRC